ncbi:amidohydrolase family protein [Nonomuraea fuscirosea]|uniref:amidohydrolase family protein n=1 Tax=Nonomuraea fuscirosea TaxID=1291556 RepID=UPI0033E2E903
MTEALAVAKEAGVRIGLGSDLIGPAQDRRGEELKPRAELETPMEALVAATKINAEILGLSDQVGVIAPGMRADFVCLTSRGGAVTSAILDETHVTGLQASFLSYLRSCRAR